MKCYRCGERIDMPVDPEVLAELRESLRLAKAEAEKANEEALEAATESAEAWERVEELRAELRRYEPSDGIMYEMLEKRTVINEAAALFERAAAENHRHPPDDNVSLDTWEAIEKWLERHRNSWTANTRPIPEPEATIRALHSVIDEARRLFDWIWDEHDNTGELGHETWARIDEWRQRVLVKEARETISGEEAKLIAVIDNCDALDAKRVERIKELEKLANDRTETILSLETERATMIAAMKLLAERQYTCLKCGRVETDWYRVSYVGLTEANARLAAENARLRGKFEKGKGNDNDANDGNHDAGDGRQAGANRKAPDQP